MASRHRSPAKTALVLFVTATLLALTCCTKKSSAQTSSSVDLQLNVKTPFYFVAYGDTRFHDPKDLEPANPAVRVALVQAIAEAKPAFVCFTGDIVYNGFDGNDWKVWDSETQIWRDKKIPVYPALGNHDVHGDPKIALGNYFQRFPDLKNSRYYSVRVANALVLVLDSSLDEVAGPQGEWLAAKLDHVPADVDFVFLMFHHPPYTSSSDAKAFGGGHSARASEQALAKIVEARQAHASFRIVVFSGHVHNYQRFTGVLNGHNVPMIVAGAGGYNKQLHTLANVFHTSKLPISIKGSNGRLENFNDSQHGYLRITVTKQNLVCEYLAVPDTSSPKTGPLKAFDSLTIVTPQYA